MLKVGDKAPEFIFSGANENCICIKDYLGSKILLFFLKDTNKDYQTINIYGSVDIHYEEFITLNTYPLCIGQKQDKFVRDIYDNITTYTPLIRDYRRSIAKRYDVEVNCITFGKNYQVINECAYIIDENGYIEKQFRKFNYHTGALLAIDYLKKHKGMKAV